MLNLSDKELDRLSREAAGQFETDENISAWEKLEQQLDQEIGTISTPPPSGAGRMAISYISLILLLAGLSFFFIKIGNKEIQQKINPAREAIIQPARLASKTASSGNSRGTQNHPNPLPAEKKNQENAVAGKYSHLENVTITESKNKPAKDQGQVVQRNSGSFPANHPTANPNQSTQIGISDKNAQAMGPRYLKSDPAKSPFRSAGIPKTQTGIQTIGVVEIASNEQKGQTLSPIGRAPVSEGLAKKQTGVHDQIGFSVLPAIQSPGRSKFQVSDSALMAYGSKLSNSRSAANQSDSKNKASLHMNRSLSFGIYLAPDFTDAGSASNDRMSSNFGLTIGYQIFKKFSLNSGVILTRKNYAANGYDFHAPPGSWLNSSNVQLNYVQGSCNMIEIPLAIRYDIDRIGKTQFFTEAGLSSYLMRNESYAYYYDYYGSPGKTEKSYHNHNNYLFSTFSLSIGVEQQISKSLAIQVEPFVKLPLTGVGFGNLNLSSYGLGFSLRYSPVIGKRRY
jgi:hypothetical protein